MNKTLKFTLALVFFSVFVFQGSHAQSNPSLRFAPEFSQIAYGNAKGTALGASLSLYFVDTDFSSTGHSAYTFTLKMNKSNGISYKEDDELQKLLEFNSLAMLVGYNYFMDGWYVEPRLGYIRGANGYHSLLFSPQVGYTYNRYDVALFCDLAKAKEFNAEQSTPYRALGISFGVMF